MRKKAFSIGTIIGFMLFGVLVVYAANLLFKTHNEKSEITPRQIFDFELSTDMQAAELGPGDDFHVAPTIKNVSTEGMYVFIKVMTPECSEGSLYEYDVNETWSLVESDGGSSVYAYSENSSMTELNPGEVTEELTRQLHMKEIAIEEFAEYDDVNIEVVGYAISTDVGGVSPVEVWEACKVLEE